MDAFRLSVVLENHGKWLRGQGGERANLEGANLEDANLACANLACANLAGANLMRANLPESKHGCVCRLDFGGWSVCVYHDLTQIGCKIQPNAKWLEWEPDSPELVAMHEDASEWWATHGEVIKAAIRCVMDNAEKFGD